MSNEGNLPKADDKGFFEADGEIWGTVRGLERHLSLGTAVLQPRLATCRQRTGTGHLGRKMIFYSLADVKKASADMLEDVPCAATDGTVEVDGEKWATASALATEVGKTP